MHIAGMPYQYNWLWNPIREALALASVTALPRVGINRIIAEPDSREVRVEIALAFMEGLEARARKLSTLLWECDGRDGLQLANDFVLHITALHNDAEVDPPIQLMHLLSRKLKRITDQLDLRQVRKSAEQYFSDARYEVDARGLLVAQGVKVSANRLGRKLVLVDKVRRECVQFLSRWEKYPALASLVIGRQLDVQVGDLELWRVLKHRRCSVDVLMRWDQHFRQIQAELPPEWRSVEQYVLEGEAKARAEIEPWRAGPLSSKGDDYFRYRRDSIEQILNELDELETPRFIEKSVGAVGDSEQLHSHDLSRYLAELGNSARDPEAGESSRVLAPPGVAQDADGEAFEGGAHADEIEGDFDVDAPGNRFTHGALTQNHDEQDSTEALHDTPVTGHLTDPCLKHVPLPLGVAVYCDLLKINQEPSVRLAMRDSLTALLLDQGVFEQLNCKPASLSKLTNAYLAACMPHVDGKPVKPASFQVMRAEAMTQFLACRQALLGKRGG